MAWALGTGVPLLGVRHRGRRRAHEVRRRQPNTSPPPCSSSASVALGGRTARDHVRRAGDRRSGHLGARGARAGRRRATSTRACPIDDGSEVGPAAGGLQPHGRRACASASGIRDLFGRQVGRGRGARGAARAALGSGARSARSGRCSSTWSARRRWRWRCRRPRSCGCSTASSGSSSRWSRREGGLVNKFEGDAALCVFGAPVASADPAGDALRAARELARRLRAEVPGDRLRHRRLRRAAPWPATSAPSTASSTP